jgi:hypothetical protein
MKKLFLSLFVLISISGQVSASHLMGGQITAKHLGGLDYIVTLTLYRDNQGVALQATQSLSVTSPNAAIGAFSVTVTSGAAVFLGNNTEEYIFTDTITFPWADIYDISWNSCCRNSAILNLSAPGTAGFFLSCNINCINTNSSPDFLNPPVTVAQQNQPFYYNPLPFDADGDSLVWSLDIPQDVGSVLGSSIPIAGYSPPSSDPSMPFTMDSLTGEISMMPNMSGNYVISIICKEYRQGVLLGQIRRDMQFIVVPAANNPVPPAFIPNNPPISFRTFTVPPGAAFSMSINAPDPDNQQVSLNAFGEALMLNQSPAIFNITTGVPANAEFIWTPAAQHARSAPYLTVFRVSEVFGPFIFSNDYSYRIFVDPTVTSVVDHQSGQPSVYPNPANEQLQIRFFSEKGGEKVTITLHNATGQLNSQTTITSRIGENLFTLPTAQLAEGLYHLRFNQSYQSPFIIKH